MSMDAETRALLARTGNALCDNCRMPHGVVFHLEQDGVNLCPTCAFAEIKAQDLASLGRAVEISRERNVCAYCGDPAEHVEHVIPRRLKQPTYTVRSCAECNLLAGGFAATCFAEKIEFIRDKIRKRYRKYMKAPEWDDEELAEMGPSMSRWLRACSTIRSWIFGRLTFDLLRLEDDEDEFTTTARRKTAKTPPRPLSVRMAAHPDDSRQAH